MFVQSKERAKELFHELIYDGLNVEVIHADRTQAQRDNIIKSFRAGRVSGRWFSSTTCTSYNAQCNSILVYTECMCSSSQATHMQGRVPCVLLFYCIIVHMLHRMGVSWVSFSSFLFFC